MAGAALLECAQPARVDGGEGGAAPVRIEEELLLALAGGPLPFERRRAQRRPYVECRARMWKADRMCGKPTETCNHYSELPF